VKIVRRLLIALTPTTFLARGGNAIDAAVATGKRTTGRMQSIMLADGWLYGFTDTRRPGGWVAGY